MFLKNCAAGIRDRLCDAHIKSLRFVESSKQNKKVQSCQKIGQNLGKIDRLEIPGNVSVENASPNSKH